MVISQITLDKAFRYQVVSLLNKSIVMSHDNMKNSLFLVASLVTESSDRDQHLTE